jgi:hypothetical protein
MEAAQAERCTAPACVSCYSQLVGIEG